MRNGYKKLANFMNTFAALDVGTEKICVSIGTANYEMNMNDYNNFGFVPKIKVLGVGENGSRGIRNQGITDAESFEIALMNAIVIAENSANTKIENVYVNIPANLLECKKITVNLKLNNGTKINKIHLNKLFNFNNCEKNLFNNFESKKIIQVWPQKYSLDSISDIDDPVGLIGSNLSAECIIVFSDNNYIQNITNCINKCNVGVSGFIADPYASCLSTLLEEEVQLGATLIDVGGKITQISYYYQGNLLWMSNIPIGSYHITSDIAICLGINLSQAERLKNLYGTLVPDKKSNEQIGYTQIGNENIAKIDYVSKDTLSKIILSRVEEIFEKTLKQFDNDIKKIYSPVLQKIIITGGGTQLKGIDAVASKIFNTKVRNALPNGIIGNDSLIKKPSYSTSAGLLFYALEDYKGIAEDNKKRLNIFQKMLIWFTDSN